MSPVLGSGQHLVDAIRGPAHTVIFAVGQRRRHADPRGARGGPARRRRVQGAAVGQRTARWPSSVADIRDVADHRPARPAPDRTDLDAIAGYLTGQRVLVTGAGGSIGSELCRQIHRFGPAELIMLDRDESALHAVQLSLDGRALLDVRDSILADIRDARRRRRGLRRAPARGRLPRRRAEAPAPAGALPGEAVKTNVWGTLTVLERGRRTASSSFVNISTDKAANPISVLGYSKRIAERLTADAAPGRRGHLPQRAVRQRARQPRLGADRLHRADRRRRPVTVTDPEVTRYFMTVEEAVQLVIQAGAIGAAGEALVLDMGEPVRIDDVARRMVEQAASPVESSTGLRPGRSCTRTCSAREKPTTARCTR